VSHTEPDHSYLVPAVLDLYPEATVVASKVAINFLKGLTNRYVTLMLLLSCMAGSSAPNFVVCLPCEATVVASKVSRCWSL
jgi:hypothetical protein